MDCSLPGSSAHGILQVTILEWVAAPPGDLPDPGRIRFMSLMSPALAGRFFTTSGKEVHKGLGSSQRWTCRTRIHIPDVFITQSCLTLCDPIDYSQPDSYVHGISQVRISEWVAIPFSRASSRLRDETQACCIAGRFFAAWATREVF